MLQQCRSNCTRIQKEYLFGQFIIEKAIISMKKKKNKLYIIIVNLSHHDALTTYSITL